MKLLENKLFKNIGNIFPVFTYLTLIYSWINLIDGNSQLLFFEIIEKKILLEILLLTIGFFLIMIGDLFKRNIREQLIFFGLFGIISIITFITCWNDTKILFSIVMILINHLVGFLSQTGDYGIEGNENMLQGKGSLFRFVMTVLYGIPIGLLIIKFNLHTDQFVVGYSIVIYYFILLFFELRILYNTFFYSRKNSN